MVSRQFLIPLLPLLLRWSVADGFFAERVESGAILGGSHGRNSRLEEARGKSGSRVMGCAPRDGSVRSERLTAGEGEIDDC